MVYPISKLTIFSFIRLFIKKTDGKENIIRNGPFIAACNHASFYDDFAVPSVILPVANKYVHFYVNSSYFKNYFFRKALAWGRCIPVDTQKSERHKEINKKAFNTALMYLRKNEIISIFPEGTRSIDGKLQKGKTGIANLAIAAKVPILPMGIIGSNKILPKGKFFPRLRRCKVNIGKPLYFKEYYNKKINKKILEDATGKVMREIAALTGQKYNY